jgi:TetR/AcrR family transcriptional repressor of bet genes
VQRDTTLHGAVLYQRTIAAFVFQTVLIKERLRSNLLYDLRPLIGDGAEGAAARLAGLIDGLYLRQGLARTQAKQSDATAQALALLHIELGGRPQ